nr:helix-turn-helix domain protein [uncultured bacterium]
MIVLPGPGLLALALGIVILGRHDPTLRRWAVLLRMSLRRLSQAEGTAVRTLGQWLRRRHLMARLLVQEQVHRHARGQPFSLGIRIWIGLTLFSALASLCLGLFMILS